MVRILVIGLGGFFGAIFRYGLSSWIQRVAHESRFPWGTLVVNLAGCFVLGLLGGLVDNKEMFRPETRAFLFIGILGAFTTFSTFGYETLALFRDGQLSAALVNVGVSVVCGILAVFFGYKLSFII